MDHHHVGSIGVFDPAKPEDSIRRMIEASNYSSNFRGSPAVKALEWALAEIGCLHLRLTDQDAAYTAGLMEGARQCREMAAKGWGTAPLNAAAEAIEAADRAYCGDPAGLPMAQARAVMAALSSDKSAEEK